MRKHALSKNRGPYPARNQAFELTQTPYHYYLDGDDQLNPGAVAGALARFVALTGDIAVIETLYAQMEAVTPEDLMHAAKKYFTPERRTVVVLKGSQS